MAKKNPKRIGLAIIGAGRVGLFRGEVAARHPQVDFIGIAEIKPDRAKLVGDRIGADFVTADYRELLARPEVTAVIVSTDEHLHVAPILAAAERGLPLFDRKAAGHRAGRFGAGIQGDRGNPGLTPWWAIRSASGGAGWRRRRRCAPASWAM